MSETGRRWSIIILRRPEKVLKRLPRELGDRLRLAIRSLACNPRSGDVEELKSRKNLYRLRVGDWRIVFAIYDDRLVVVVVEVVPRGGAYRRR